MELGQLCLVEVHGLLHLLGCFAHEAAQSRETKPIIFFVVKYTKLVSWHFLVLLLECFLHRIHDGWGLDKVRLAVDDIESLLV